MSKTVEQSISSSQKKGLIKMHSILVNMAQDDNVGDFVVIRGNQYTLGQVSTVIKQYVDRTTYTRDEKQYLNEVRNFVLAYQDGTLRTGFDEDNFNHVSWTGNISWFDTLPF
jgi:exopolysaccharide biosynthesis predicted pyruvyltransferase EpsI